MLDACEDTAPVTTVQSFINHSVDFDINSIAAENLVINSSEEIEKPALLAHGRTARGILVDSPCFGFVVRHARSLNQRLRRLHQKSCNLRNPFLCSLTQAYGACEAMSENRKLNVVTRLNVTPASLDRNESPKTVGVLFKPTNGGCPLTPAKGRVPGI